MMPSDVARSIALLLTLSGLQGRMPLHTQSSHLPLDFSSEPLGGATDSAPAENPHRVAKAHDKLLSGGRPAFQGLLLQPAAILL